MFPLAVAVNKATRLLNNKRTFVDDILVAKKQM